MKSASGDTGNCKIDSFILISLKNNLIRISKTLFTICNSSAYATRKLFHTLWHSIYNIHQGIGMNVVFLASTTKMFVHNRLYSQLTVRCHILFPVLCAVCSHVWILKWQQPKCEISAKFGRVSNQYYHSFLIEREQKNDVFDLSSPWGCFVMWTSYSI